jgi:hypothetical protein
MVQMLDSLPGPQACREIIQVNAEEPSLTLNLDDDKRPGLHFSCFCEYRHNADRHGYWAAAVSAAAIFGCLANRLTLDFPSSAEEGSKTTQ